MMNCGIYKIVSPSGNFYAGSSNDIRGRGKRHFSALRRGKHHSIFLQRAWEKYGTALRLEVMLVCAEDDLFFYEQLVLDRLKPRYNVAKTVGAAMRGVKHGPEVIEKIAASSKRRWAENPEYRSNMSAMTIALNKNRAFSPETRAKMSELGKAYYDEHPEIREARSISGRAQRHTDEAKVKISVAAKAMWETKPGLRAEVGARRAATNKAKVWTPEDRAAMSAIKAARYAADPDLKARIAASVTGFKHSDAAKAKIAETSRNASPETKAKRSASLKAAWARRKLNLKGS